MEGVALIALGFLVWIVGTNLMRRRRRRDMGLPPRAKSWRDDPSVQWTTPRYYGGARRRLHEKETQ